jgi:hypothetical protein
MPLTKLRRGFCASPAAICLTVSGGQKQQCSDTDSNNFGTLSGGQMSAPTVRFVTYDERKGGLGHHRPPAQETTLTVE